MKVLKEGNPNGWETEQICTGKGNGDGGCGAQLLVSANDIYRTTGAYHDNTLEIYYTFRCPCCSRETDIPDTQIPSAVRADIMRRYDN